MLIRGMLLTYSLTGRKVMSNLNGVTKTSLSEGNFLDGRRDGEQKAYYQSGEIFSIRRYSKGVPHGKSEFYYPNGVKKTEIPYDNGEVHGIVPLYFDNGNLKREAQYYRGIKDNTDTFWNYRGNKVGQKSYKLGTLLSERYWDNNNHLIKEILYQDGKEKEVKLWDTEGNLMASENREQLDTSCDVS